LRQAAQLDASGATRLLACHAAAHLVGDRHFEVGFQLLIEFLVEPTLAKNSVDACHYDVKQRFHG
jgi:hypothetical protein